MPLSAELVAQVSGLLQIERQGMDTESLHGWNALAEKLLAEIDSWYNAERVRLTAQAEQLRLQALDQEAIELAPILAVAEIGGRVEMARSAKKVVDAALRAAAGDRTKALLALRAQLRPQQEARRYDPSRPVGATEKLLLGGIAYLQAGVEVGQPPVSQPSVAQPQPAPTGGDHEVKTAAVAPVETVRSSPRPEPTRVESGQVEPGYAELVALCGESRAAVARRFALACARAAGEDAQEALSVLDQVRKGGGTLSAQQVALHKGLSRLRGIEIGATVLRLRDGNVFELYVDAARAYLRGQAEAKRAKDAVKAAAGSASPVDVNRLRLGGALSNESKDGGKKKS